MATDKKRDIHSMINEINYYDVTTHTYKNQFSG